MSTTHKNMMPACPIPTALLLPRRLPLPRPLHLHLRLRLLLSLLTLLTLLPFLSACGDSSASSSEQATAAASKTPAAISRYAFTVINQTKIPLDDLVITGFDRPVKFSPIPSGQTSMTLIGPAGDRPPKKVEFTWNMPNGDRKSKNIHISREIPHDFNGKLTFTFKSFDSIRVKAGRGP